MINRHNQVLSLNQLLTKHKIPQNNQIFEKIDRYEQTRTGSNIEDVDNKYTQKFQNKQYLFGTSRDNIVELSPQKVDFECNMKIKNVLKSLSDKNKQNCCHQRPQSIIDDITKQTFTTRTDYEKMRLQESISYYKPKVEIKKRQEQQESELNTAALTQTREQTQRNFEIEMQKQSLNRLINDWEHLNNKKLESRLEDLGYPSQFSQLKKKKSQRPRKYVQGMLQILMQRKLLK